SEFMSQSDLVACIIMFLKATSELTVIFTEEDCSISDIKTSDSVVY
ncbi:27702_t:CDS:1, partial [Dentiscutata erythropus]